MIHYTLLPYKEIKILRKEYRTRFAISLLFFVSCGVSVGIASLVPAFILSYTQNREVLGKLETLQKTRESSPANSLVNELSVSSEIIKRINDNQGGEVYSQLIGRIIEHKRPGITLNSFQMSESEDETSTTTIAIIQGRAVTRDGLVAFKDSLGADPSVLEVELPVSDLARSSNISFSIRVLLKNQNEN